MLKRLPSLLSVLLFLCLPTSCKKEDATVPAAPNPGLPAIAFELSVAEAVPQQVIAVTFTASQVAKELNATIGSAPISLTQVDAFTYSLVVPESLNVGTYPVNLSNSSVSKPLKVNAKRDVANPAQYNQAFLKQGQDLFAYVKATQDSLVKSGLQTSAESALLIAQMEARFSEAQTSLQTATDAEKKRCATFLEANRAQLDSVFLLIKSLGDLSLRNGRMAQRLGPTTEPFDDTILAFGYALHTGGPKLATLIATVAVAFAGGGPVAAAAAGVVAYAAWQAFFSTYNRFIAAVGFLDRTGEKLKLSITSGIKIANNVVRTLSASVPTVNFQEDQQADSPNSTIRAVVSVVRMLREKLANAVIQPFINVSIPKVPPKSGEVPVEVASRLKVTVSNPTVTATVKAFRTGSVDLAFSTTQPTDQSFDATVEYTYEGTKVAQTITGNTLQVAAPLTFRLTTPGSTLLTASGTVNTAYTFTMAADNWTPNAATLITWNWGDGSSIDQVQGSATVKHTYTKEGTFPLRAWFATADNTIYEATASVTIGIQQQEYYFQLTTNGTTYTFDPQKSYAHTLAGRFDIVANVGQLQAGIFFEPASLLSSGPSVNAFKSHCKPTPEQPTTYVLGSHLYSFATSKTIATTYSLGSAWGCAGSQSADYTAPGNLTITQNDGSVITGTFEYIDFISKQPVQGTFRVPIQR